MLAVQLPGARLHFWLIPNSEEGEHARRPGVRLHFWLIPNSEDGEHARRPAARGRGFTFGLFLIVNKVSMLAARV